MDLRDFKNTFQKERQFEKDQTIPKSFWDSFESLVKVDEIRSNILRHQEIKTTEDRNKIKALEELLERSRAKHLPPSIFDSPPASPIYLPPPEPLLRKDPIIGTFISRGSANGTFVYRGPRGGLYRISQGQRQSHQQVKPHEIRPLC